MFSSNLKEGRVWELRRIIRNKEVINEDKGWQRVIEGMTISKIYTYIKCHNGTCCFVQLM